MSVNIERTKCLNDDNKIKSPKCINKKSIIASDASVPETTVTLSANSNKNRFNAMIFLNLQRKNIAITNQTVVAYNSQADKDRDSNTNKHNPVISRQRAIML